MSYLSEKVARLQKEINTLKERLGKYEAREAQFLKAYGVTIDSYLANMPTSEDAGAMAERE